MKEYALTGATIITPYMEIKNGTLLVSENKILAVGREENIVIPEDMKRIDVSGLTMLPGFIDIHIHGSLGISASDSFEGLRRIYEYLPSTGTTSWLPTIMNEKGINVIVTVMKEQKSGSEILGIHMEGPFLAPKNIPGTPHEEPRYPNLKEYEEMLKLAEGTIRLMGLAPELDGALPVIREMGRTGVVAAVAHSKATYE
ncbi:MAG: amidohydrolase family protein, partial [Clostridiales bacterium]|nr:amidohydrolase family protein [Clostridiales bacterium]